MGSVIFFVEHNALIYEFTLDTQHKWIHHTKWPDGKESYRLLQNVGETLKDAKIRCKQYIIAWFEDPKSFHIDDKYVDMNNEYIKIIQKSIQSNK